MIANERRVVSILSVGSSSLPAGIARVESMLTRTRKPSSSRKTSFVRASSTIILCISAVIYIDRDSRQHACPAIRVRASRGARWLLTSSLRWTLSSSTLLTSSRALRILSIRASSSKSSGVSSTISGSDTEGDTDAAKRAVSGVRRLRNIIA
jgi:hypothetical protein